MADGALAGAAAAWATAGEVISALNARPSTVMDILNERNIGCVTPWDLFEGNFNRTALI
jgi:hypothetical protein